MGFKFLTTLFVLLLLTQTRSENEENEQGDDGQSGDDDQDDDNEQNNNKDNEDDENQSDGDESDEQLFKDFQKRYNREYANDEEYQKRFDIFKQNKKKIENLNKRGGAVYELNQFSDLSTDEFLENNTGLKMPSASAEILSNHTANQLNIVNLKASLPDDFDWSKQGKVTRVKDQGGCGSCWTFSAIGNIESMYAIKYGELLELSEQQLLDCDRKNFGCIGGWPLQAILSVRDTTGGLNYEEDYQYSGQQQECRFNKNNRVITVANAYSLNKDEEYMRGWINNFGPISVALNVAPWMSYKSGIAYFNEQDCPQVFNHAVLIVGWGIENNVPYWKIKNSWGPGWGDNGYAKLYRGVNFCGIREVAVSAWL